MCTAFHKTAYLHMDSQAPVAVFSAIPNPQSPLFLLLKRYWISYTHQLSTGFLDTTNLVLLLYHPPITSVLKITLTFNLMFITMVIVLVQLLNQTLSCVKVIFFSNKPKDFSLEYEIRLIGFILKYLSHILFLMLQQTVSPWTPALQAFNICHYVFLLSSTQSTL